MVVLQGNVAARLVETADSTGADLMVLGSTHRRFCDEAIAGSTTERVVRYAGLPALTIVPAPAVTTEEKAEEELVYAGPGLAGANRRSPREGHAETRSSRFFSASSA